MSCDYKTGPVNIISTDTTCNYKCNYSYKYSLSSVTAINNANSLRLKLNDTTSIMAEFSSSGGKGSCGSFSDGHGKFTLNYVYISTPSIHTYNGDRANGEVILYHSNITGGKDLIVCIPITITGGTQDKATT